MKTLLYLLISSVTISLCGFSKGPPPIYHPVSDAIKKDFNFKPGTYWIMRDSVSGKVDSFCVTGNYDYTEQTNQGGRNNPAEYYEYASVYILDYNTTALPVIDTQTWAYRFVGSFVKLVYHVEFYARDFPMGYIFYGLFSYPKQDSFFLETKYDSTDTVEINHVLANCQINGNSFSKVAVIHQYASYLRYDSGIYTHRYTHNDLFYICPKIGIVKMRLNHPQDSINQVWELQRWNKKM